MKTSKRETLSVSIFVLSILFVVVLQPVTSVSGQYYPTSSYKLTIYSNNQLAGTTSPSPGVVYVDYGISVQVIALTNPGYIFNGWYLNGVYQHKLSTITVTMLHDNVLMASFTQEGVMLTITTNPSQGGTTNPPSGSLFYQYGSSVQVAAYPNPDYTFNGWYLNGVFMGNETSIMVNMTERQELGAYFGGDSSEPPLVTLPPSNLTVSCESHTTYSDFNVKITGALMNENGTGVPYSGILLYLSVTGGESWDILSFVNTDADGEFSVSWKPSVTGYFLLNATWMGSSAYSGTSTVVNFAVTPFEEQSVFSVTSNSTLAGLSFNSETNEFSFSVTGPSGTTGYTKVLIPKSLVSDVSSIDVYFDESEMAFSSTSKADAWELFFNYPHSTHQVVVNLDAPLPPPDSSFFETPLGMALIVGGIVAAAVVVAFVVMRKRCK